MYHVEPFGTVFVVKRDETVIAVYAKEEDAQAFADEMNAG